MNARDFYQTVSDTLADGAHNGVIDEEMTLTPKEVRIVIDAINETVANALYEEGAVKLPGLLSLRLVDVPAKPRRKGVNPWTGEETTFKAKPATQRIRVRALTGLKDACGIKRPRRRRAA